MLTDHAPLQTKKTHHSKLYGMPLVMMIICSEHHASSHLKLWEHTPQHSHACLPRLPCRRSPAGLGVCDFHPGNRQIAAARRRHIWSAAPNNALMSPALGT